MIKIKLLISDFSFDQKDYKGGLRKMDFTKRGIKLIKYLSNHAEKIIIEITYKRSIDQFNLM